MQLKEKRVVYASRLCDVGITSCNSTMFYYVATRTLKNQFKNVVIVGKSNLNHMLLRCNCGNGRHNPGSDCTSILLGHSKKMILIVIDPHFKIEAFPTKSSTFATVIELSWTYLLSLVYLKLWSWITAHTLSVGNLKPCSKMESNILHLQHTTLLQRTCWEKKEAGRQNWPE